MFKQFSQFIGARSCFRLALWAALLLFCVTARTAEKTPVTPQFFDKSIRPILTEYCLKCHSTEKQKGDLDLEQFSSLKEVLKHPKIWMNVAEQLGNN